MAIRYVLKALLAGTALSVVLVTVSCSNNDANPGSSSTDGGGQAPNSVSISNFAFSPQTITVTAGTEITWTNKDAAAHTVTSDDGNFPSSGNLSQGQTYKVTFSTAGTYPYHCAIHPSMKGTVIVNP